MACALTVDPGKVTKLVARGVMPKQCQSLSIDVSYNAAVMITFRCLIGGDDLEEILDATTAGRKPHVLRGTDGTPAAIDDPGSDQDMDT